MADFNASFKLQLEGDQEIKKKFEDLEQTLQDVKNAAEDTSKPLEDTAKAMDDVAKQAGDVDKNLGDTSKTLDDVSKSASDIKKDMDDVDKSFSDVSKSAVDVSSDLKDADSAFEDISSNANASVSSMDAVKSSFEGISESAVEADQNIAAATTGLEGVGTATESAAAGADSLATSLDNIAASAQEAETNISAAANGIDGIGTSIGEAETALDGLGSAFDGAGTSTTTFNDVLTSTGTQAQAASGGLTPLNTVLGQVGGATQQAQSGFQGFNSSLGIMTGFIGTAASGAIQFAQALSNLHGAQIKVEATQSKLSTSSEAVAKAQAKLNELLASGTATTAEIEQATLDLTQATEKNNIAIERAGKAQDDLNIKYAKFGTDVLPSLIQTVTSTIAAVSQMKQAFEGVNFGQLAAGAAGVGAAILTIVEALELLNAVQISNEFFDADTLDEKIKKMKEFRDSIKDVPLVANIQVPKLDADIAELEKLKKAYETLGIPIPKVNELLSTYKERQQTATGGTKALNSEMSLTPEAALAAADAISKDAGAQKDLETAAAATIGPIRDQKQAFEEAKASVESSRGAIDTYTQGVEKQIEVSNSLTVQMQEGNEALIEHVNQTNALAGSQENATNAILKIADSLAQHNANIHQLNVSLQTSEGQLLSYQNAVAAGDEAFLRWVQTTRDAATEAETFKGRLVAMANTFGGLPGFMEGTVEEYQAFNQANKGGEAVKEFERMALESWRGLTSAAKPLFDDLKSAWAEIFEGTTMEKAADAIAAANDKIAQNVADNNQAIVDSAEGTAPKIKDIFDGVDWGAVTEAMTDPFIESFNKLPIAVSDTLSNVEREALTFQAKFAQTAEMAGTAWATNLQANMGQGFDTAIQHANQAAADVLAPFIEQHPETAQMFDPLFDAMNQTGPGAAQAVQEVLTQMSGMPGPIGDVAKEMLTNYETEFAGKLPGVTKTGVEGALVDLTQIMAEGMNKIVEKLNTLINTGIKQDPASVPLITANTNPANTAIQLIGKSLTQLQTYLEENPLQIYVATTGGQEGVEGAGVATNPATKVITSILTSYQQLQTTLTETPLTITLDATAATTAIDGLNTKIDAMAGKNVTITVDTGPAGIAITGLQAQIDAVHGKEIAITVNTGPAGIAITTLQGDIDAVHGTNVFITVDTGSAGTAIREIQGQIDGVHGTNVYITVDTSGAQAAIQQLQQQINSLQQSMSGIGTGYTPGYQSPYGSYLGAYGAPGMAKGFGPAIIDRPTRILVGEAGPELVSVIPMKNKRQVQTKTAAAGFGGMSYWSGGPYGPIGDDPNWSPQQMQQGAEQGTMQGSQQGTEQGMQQSQAGMQDAVQQGAMQGTQQGYQQVESRIQQALLAGNMAEAMVGFGHGYGFNWSGGAMGTGLGMGGGAQYPTAPSNTEIWGAGRFTWGGGAAGAQLGGGNMGGAQYPTAGVPLGPEHAIGFGSRPIKYTWGGGASGMTLTPHGPHVGEGLPGPDPHAFGGGGGGNPYSPGGAYSQPGGGVPEGYRLPGYEGQTDAEYERNLLAERDRIAKERGATMGAGASKNFVKAFDAGVEGQSQQINGVSATILSGNGGPARQAGNEAGVAAGQGFAEGFNSQTASMTSPLTQGQAGYPKAYTGEVPASYGKPLGQLINGIAATILPGQGPRGPPMQAAFGMHQKLRRDTLIQAHRNERVDISPGANAAEAAGKASDYVNATMDRITALLEKLLSQGSTFKVDFNVDGRKMSSVAAKHMGTTGYGDK